MSSILFVYLRVALPTKPIFPGFVGARARVRRRSAAEKAPLAGRVLRLRCPLSAAAATCVCVMIDHAHLLPALE